MAAPSPPKPQEQAGKGTPHLVGLTLVKSQVRFLTVRHPLSLEHSPFVPVLLKPDPSRGKGQVGQLDGR